MKTTLLTLLTFGFIYCAVLAQGTHKSGPTDAAQKDDVRRWSIVGEWTGTHPAWTDTLLIRAGGTIESKEMVTTGHWTLTAEGGTPLLVIRWNDFGTESLTMVDANYFRGQIEPGVFFEIRRVINAP